MLSDFNKHDFRFIVFTLNSIRLHYLYEISWIKNDFHIFESVFFRNGDFTKIDLINK